VTQTAADHIPADAPPKPIVKKMRWPFPFVWIVPLCALVAAGYFLYQYHQEQATQITIRFDSAEGLRVGQTPVTVRGVTIGKVADIELSPDQRQALVHVDLRRPYISIARGGALFWIVRPDFSDGNFSGLGTVVSGPYIEAVPGVGEPESEFVGLAKEPVSLGDGLIVLLYSDKLEHLQPDSPVYYRGVQVGVIQGLQLSSDSTHVEIRAVIRPRYAPLVTAGTKFWSVSGADIEGGIFSGISVKLDSLRALLTGGVAFATPEDHSSEPVKDGAKFTLNAEPKKDWLTWAPKIALPPEQPDSPPNPQLQSVGVTSTLSGK
jgi:paraquat-inducible protein B